MVKEHLLLREYSGKPWSLGSITREYLEKLPVANAEENFKESDTRYLLPRKNIFTFGLENGITERVIYYACKICHAFIKPHNVKNHMVTKHTKHDSSLGSVSQIPSSTSVGSKSKKNSHKNKRKVVPPPSVPPPPLFPKTDYLVVNAAPSEELPPPVLQPAENIDIKVPVNEDIKPLLATTPAAPVVTTTANETPTTKVTPTSTPLFSSPPVEGPSTKKATPVFTSSKIREPCPKIEKEVKRKRSKRSRNSDDYDPDKHCGVLDSLKRPCLRALTCANHTIIERRAVAGRSKNVDKLIVDYKASRIKNKPQPLIPIAIAPKQCSYVEAKAGLQIIELIYGDGNSEDADYKCDTEDPLLATLMKELATNIAAQGRPEVLKSPDCFLKLNPDLDHIRRVTKLPMGAFVTLNLSQSSPPVSKGGEVPSQTPTLYTSHPKPLTVLTSPIRRVGSSFVLQQEAQRLERQRLDLQAVVNQHKQLKVSSPSKQIMLLNSNNHSKQSILKSSVKNNTKAAPLKRPAIEKSNINDIKHVKVLSTDMNGFILNSDFSDNETQEKTSLLK